MGRVLSSLSARMKIIIALVLFSGTLALMKPEFPIQGGTDRMKVLTCDQYIKYYYKPAILSEYFQTEIRKTEYCQKEQEECDVVWGKVVKALEESCSKVSEDEVRDYFTDCRKGPINFSILPNWDLIEVVRKNRILCYALRELEEEEYLEHYFKFY